MTQISAPIVRIVDVDKSMRPQNPPNSWTIRNVVKANPPTRAKYFTRSRKSIRKATASNPEKEGVA
jgi:hypothetical protein